jgi:hypothetical protein
MINRFTKQFNKFVAITLICTFVLSSVPLHLTHGQTAVWDPINLVQNVLTQANTAASSLSQYYLEYKESVLDGLAWSIAKEILKSMTADIVDWINGGFSGEPAFISNPEGFFMDAADQVTGAFLANSGPLTQLCSPFSLDIRLSLALQLSNRSRRTRYTCTLSKIIDSVQKSSVNVGASVTVNGVTYAQARGRASVGGFVQGDFYQGGWPAFVAMTTEPQNNVYGAYLQAHSEVSSSIAQNQAKINADLSMGSGFLSREKCEDVRSIDPESIEAQNYYPEPGTKIKKNKDGTTTVQSCKTETPGSVISGSLSKQLGAPVDQLNIADEIDEIISAAFSQLVLKVLQGGLSSQGSKSNPDSVINQLAKETGKALEKMRKKITTQLNKLSPDILEYSTARQQAFALVDGERSIFEYTSTCLKNSPSSTTPAYVSAIQSLDKRLTDYILPAVKKYGDLNTKSGEVSAIIEEIRTSTANATRIEELQEPSSKLAELIQSHQIVKPVDLVNAKKDLEEATEASTAWHAEAVAYQPMCTVTPTTP